MKVVIRRGKANPWTPSVEIRVLRLHNAGHSPAQIAFRVKRKEALVLDCLGRYGLRPNAEKPPKGHHSPMGEGPPAEKAASPEGENPVRAVEALLGARLQYRPTGERLLDGRACTLDQMMRAGNEILKRRGLPQKGKNPAWMA